MKRRAIACLAALLALSLAACAAETETTNEPLPTQTVEATTVPEEPETHPTETTEEPAEPSDETTEFVFTRENFPRLDGSTSLVPLGQAVASVLLGESREDAADLAQFNRTTQSFRNLKDGECDLLLVSEPNAAVFDELDEAGFAYEMEPIATEALIFVVNEDNPIDSLTTEQIRGIYTGEITNWSEVGGDDAEIVPFQRNEGAGSQALMVKLVMGDTPMMDAPKDYIASAMGELMEVVRSYDNTANAIGYSVYYYANEMRMADGLKIIAVDGVEPSDETIRDGSYPHRNAYYAVIAADEAEDSPTRILYDWMVSPDGQRLVETEGYVSVTEETT
jgi:ABC-type phosphate transport system substrate-binding protein